MAWLEPVFKTVSAVSLAKDLKPSIHQTVKRIYHRIKYGRVCIPVFGGGGVGKTTLGKLLLEEKPLGAPQPYDESWSDEHVKIAGDIPGILLIPPGQKDRIERYWPALLSQVSGGKCAGIINVVAFGYHSFNLETFRDHDLYVPNQELPHFLSSYLEKRREIEIELLKKVADGLQYINKPVWFITLVCKQDLWWDQRASVKDHYEKGEYAQITAHLSQRLGSSRFQHEFIPVSLTISNWITANNEILAETVSGYDQKLHINHLLSMLEHFRRLIERGNPR